MLASTLGMPPALLARLKCPVCGAAMGISENGKSILCHPADPCARVHCFDRSSDGYLPLAPRHAGGGDSKDAVRARTAFLSAGYYDAPARAVVKALSDYTPAGGCVLDAGCGEGYYSLQMARAGYDVLGVDLSKFAVAAAAKAVAAEQRKKGSDTLSDALYAVGSVFDLPLKSGCMNAVTNIFAPCAPREYARVLGEGGHLLVVGAGERHLFGLKALLYDDPYLNDPRRDLPKEEDGFELVETRSVKGCIKVEGESHIAALFSMTPYYWRTPKESRERLGDVSVLETEIAFDIHVYRKI